MNVELLKIEEKDLYLEMGSVFQVGDGAHREKFRQKVRAFLGKLGEECKQIEYADEYGYINEAATRWEGYLRSEHNELERIKIEAPEIGLKVRVPLEDPFERFVKTAPSSGKVMTGLANQILQNLKSINVLKSEEKEKIMRHVDFVMKYRPLPSLKLAHIIKGNLDNVKKLRSVLNNHIKTKSKMDLIGKKLKPYADHLGFVPGCHILTYGYSEVFSHLLNMIDKAQRKDISISVAECRHRLERHDGSKTLEEMRELGFKPGPILDTQYYDLFKEKKVTALLMGCKVMGRNSNGLEVLNTVGSGSFARCAKEHDIKVFILAGKYKIFCEELYEEARSKYAKLKLTHRKMSAVLDLPSDNWGDMKEFELPRSDLIEAQYIDFFITEDGLFNDEEFINNYSRYFS